MTFYDRESEIDILREIEENARDFAQMTILMGRRRVGKTTLLKNAFAASHLFFCIEKNGCSLI
jgi:AAA+ ATPase superfamily predicted ATPase